MHHPVIRLAVVLERCEALLVLREEGDGVPRGRLVAEGRGEGLGRRREDRLARQRARQGDDRRTVCPREAWRACDRCSAAHRCPETLSARTEFKHLKSWGLQDRCTHLKKLPRRDVEAYGVRHACVEHALHFGGVCVAPLAVVLGVHARSLGRETLLLELLLAAEAAVRGTPCPGE